MYSQLKTNTKSERNTGLKDMEKLKQCTCSVHCVFVLGHLILSQRCCHYYLHVYSLEHYLVCAAEITLNDKHCPHIVLIMSKREKFGFQR